jgi:hypothetical protein
MRKVSVCSLDAVIRHTPADAFQGNGQQRILLELIYAQLSAAWSLAV